MAEAGNKELRSENGFPGKELESKKVDFEEYMEYDPKYDPAEMAVLIKRASKSWADVKDVDQWLNELRG